MTKAEVNKHIKNLNANISGIKTHPVRSTVDVNQWSIEIKELGVAGEAYSNNLQYVKKIYAYVEFYNLRCIIEALSSIPNYYIH